MKKCGLYLRVSTDEQAKVMEGSLKVQRVRLEALVKSKNNEKEKWKVHKIYTEEGFSGKNLNRPQMQLLIEDVKKGSLNVVLCVRIDRITRSLLDFYWLYQVFQTNNVDFICLDDYFDTSTPIGRMALKMILVFAELEREQVSDRTKKNLFSRANSGLWTGGHVLGYDLDFARPGYLKPNEKEKNLVNTIFQTYLNSRSFRKTCKYLNDTGYHTKSYFSKNNTFYKGNRFNYQRLSHILKNQLYIGKIEINKKNKDKEQSSLPFEQRYYITDGKHTPLINHDLFYKTQLLIANNTQIKKSFIPKKLHVFLLKGLLHCGVCGFSMHTTWARGHGGDYFYYTCICNKKFLRADIIENEIISKVRKYTFDIFFNNEVSKIKIVPGTMDKTKIMTFLRRINSTTDIYKKNILGLIIKRINYKPDEISIEIN